MSELKAEGKVIKLYPVQEISATFKKQEFVIETEEEYPQYVKFECKQGNVEKLSKIKEGDRVTVYFNLRGREWQKEVGSEVKYFTNLECWRIEKKEATATVSASSEPPADTFSDTLPF